MTLNTAVPALPPKEHRAPAGYDLRLVAGVRCLHCNEPIGHEPYVDITLLARFGSMLFAHQRCTGRAT